MKRAALMVAAALVAAPACGQAQQGLHGAWLQTAPAWAINAENPWTVMIFNPDGSFCGGSGKDNRYSVGTYTFDGTTLTTTGETGRVTSRTIEFGANGTAQWNDPQLDEPVGMLRTDKFANCEAMRAHQDSQ